METLILFAGIWTVLFALSGIVRLRPRRADDRRLCASCRYDLSGLSNDAICPECGRLSTLPAPPRLTYSLSHAFKMLNLLWWLLPCLLVQHLLWFALMCLVDGRHWLFSLRYTMLLTYDNSYSPFVDNLTPHIRILTTLLGVGVIVSILFGQHRCRRFVKIGCGIFLFLAVSLLAWSWYADASFCTSLDDQAVIALALSICAVSGLWTWPAPTKDDKAT